VTGEVRGFISVFESVEEEDILDVIERVGNGVATEGLFREVVDLCVTDDIKYY
jgi:hypothetical protein